MPCKPSVSRRAAIAGRAQRRPDGLATDCTTGTAERTAPAKKGAPSCQRGAWGLRTCRRRARLSCPPGHLDYARASEPGKREPFGRPNETAAYQGAMALPQRAIAVCNAAPLISTLARACTPIPRPSPTRPEQPYSKAEAPKRSNRLGVLLWQSRGEHSAGPAPNPLKSVSTFQVRSRGGRYTRNTGNSVAAQ